VTDFKTHVLPLTIQMVTLLTFLSHI